MNDEIGKITEEKQDYQEYVESFAHEIKIPIGACLLYTSKEKKVHTVKVGTHKKTVIALWVVLIASVSFGVYKNFTDVYKRQM